MGNLNDKNRNITNQIQTFFKKSKINLYKIVKKQTLVTLPGHRYCVPAFLLTFGTGK